MRRKPSGFRVLTGEDALYFTMMANGADGGILAASHLMTGRFVDVARRFAANDYARSVVGVVARRSRAVRTCEST